MPGCGGLLYGYHRSSTLSVLADLNVDYVMVCFFVLNLFCIVILIICIYMYIKIDTILIVCVYEGIDI